MSVYDHLPAYYRVADRNYSTEEAFAYTADLARQHYENFTVVSRFLPAQLRQHMFNVYAYCRWADDLGDEVPGGEAALAALAWWRGELERCYAGDPGHPVFVALRETITAFDIPADPFHHLLDAFVQDQTVRRFETYAQVLDYCTRSANPVGRLVLYLFGYRDDERQRLSDATCSGLQLANFWQDVTVDWQKDRVYLPQEDLRRFGVTEEQIAARRFSPEFRTLMEFEVRRARELFHAGQPLIKSVDRRLRLDLELFTRGGLEILNLIERQNYDVLSRRPAISKGRKVGLVLRRLVGQVVGR